MHWRKTRSTASKRSGQRTKQRCRYSRVWFSLFVQEVRDKKWSTAEQKLFADSVDCVVTSRTFTPWDRIKNRRMTVTGVQNRLCHSSHCSALHRARIYAFIGKPDWQRFCGKIAPALTLSTPLRMGRRLKIAGRVIQKSVVNLFCTVWIWLLSSCAPFQGSLLVGLVFLCVGKNRQEILALISVIIVEARPAVSKYCFYLNMSQKNSDNQHGSGKTSQHFMYEILANVISNCIRLVQWSVIAN